MKEAAQKELETLEQEHEAVWCVSFFIHSTSSCDLFHKVLAQKKSHKGQTNFGLTCRFSIHLYSVVLAGVLVWNWFCSPSHGSEYKAVLKNNGRRSWPTLMAEKLEKARTKSKRSMKHEEIDVQYTCLPQFLELERLKRLQPLHQRRDSSLLPSALDWSPHWLWNLMCDN